MPQKPMNPGSIADADHHEGRLLDQIAAGDRRAFEQFFYAYYPRVLRFSVRMVKRQSLAEEVVNDVMLVIWKKAGSFAGHSRISTWVFGIAYRTSLKALRGQKRHHRLVQNQDVLDQASVEGGYGALEDQQWLAKGFDALSVEQRAVVELSYFAGYGYAEIAKILDCPTNTIKTRMFHARKKLKTAMPELAGTTPNLRNNNERS